jgi:hypothetical protein
MNESIKSTHEFENQGIKLFFNKKIRMPEKSKQRKNIKFFHTSWEMLHTNNAKLQILNNSNALRISSSGNIHTH